MNILHITFDYADVIYKNQDFRLEVNSRWKTLRWTGSVETNDDLYLIKNKLAKIITIAWSRYEKKNRYYHKEWFYIIRDKIWTDKLYYDKFVLASNQKGAQKILLEYNKYLLKKTIKSIESINKKRVKLWFNEIQIDLIITPTSWFTIDSCLRLKSLLNVPVVSTLHVNEEELQNIETFKLPRVDLILKYDFITKCYSDWIIAKNKNILWTISDYNINWIEVNNDIEFPWIFNKRITKSISVIYVWRLSFEKWLDRLFSLASLLYKDWIDLHICWKTLWLDKNVEKIFDKLIALDNVKYHGHVGKKKLVNLLNQSKIIILPSRTEAFNQAIIEWWYFWCIPLSTNVWSAEKCLDKEHIIYWSSEIEIIKSFYDKIKKYLKNYSSDNSISLNKKFKKYFWIINKQKRYLYFKKIINVYKK